MILKGKEEFTFLTNDVFIDTSNQDKFQESCYSLFNAIPLICCDEKTREFIINKILPKCSFITVEYPYYESDYLSTYYMYHVRKFQPVSKFCCRLILYDIEGNCVGYISLRPIADDRKIGRTYLNPKVFAPSNYEDLSKELCNRRFFVIWGKYKIHVGGSEGYIDAVPYMQQEGDVAVCAHVSLWSVLRFFSSRFHNSKEYTMGEIVSLVPSPQMRKIPSQGLTVEQISTVLTEAGFSTIIIRSNNKYQDLFYSEVITYIDSGIPVIAFSKELAHAVVLCGRIETNKSIFYDSPAHSSDPEKETLMTRLNLLAESPESLLGVKTNTKLLFDSSFVDCVLVNDDNKAPYYAIPRLTTGEFNRKDLSNFSQVDFCIVPLYKRMQLSYFDAKNIVSLLCSDSKYIWDENPLGSEFDDFLVIKMNIASSNTVKEFIKINLEQKKIPEELNILLNIPYSRFLWIAQVSTLKNYKKGTCNGLILLDTTCSVSDTNVCLALADQRKCEFVRADQSSSAFEINYDRGPDDPNFNFSLPLFYSNFKEIRR